MTHDIHYPLEIRSSYVCLKYGCLLILHELGVTVIYFDKVFQPGAID